MFESLWSDWRRFCSSIRVAPLVVADACLSVSGADKTHIVTDTGRNSENWTAACNSMVDWQLERRGIRDAHVLAAMRAVPRHLFVPPNFVSVAYEDSPLPIGYSQTISQPYIVAFMTDALKLKPGDKVLEIGTGCGYQTAVLSKLVHEVYTIEIVPQLAQAAKERLTQIGYANVHCKTGDGYRGWPEHGPFDAIMVTAAPSHVPQPLLDQLAPGGRMVLPVGTWWQSVKRITRTAHGTVEEDLLPVQFVPMTGEAAGQR